MAAVINMTEGAAPSTPGANTHDLYVDTSGNWHILDDAGTDKTLASTADVFATANIADEAIVNAKLADMDEATIKGRAASAGTGVPVDLTAAQVATILAGSFPAIGDADWTTITPFGTGYTTAATLYPSTYTYAVPGYRKMSGLVHLRGAVRTGGTSLGVALGTLPAGYRPAADFMASCASATSSARAAVTLIVMTTGEVWLPGAANTTYHLDGISFAPA